MTAEDKTIWGVWREDDSGLGGWADNLGTTSREEADRKAVELNAATRYRFVVRPRVAVASGPEAQWAALLAPHMAALHEAIDWAEKHPLRVGRKLGRTLYAKEELIGMLDAAEDAAAIVRIVNAAPMMRLMIKAPEEGATDRYAGYFEGAPGVKTCMCCGSTEDIPHTWRECAEGQRRMRRLQETP